MYNYMRKCVLNSVKSYKKLFAQVTCNKTTTCSNVQYTNISLFWNDTTCKRFYCQVTVQDVKIPLSPQAKKTAEEQQKLDEFLSNPDNNKLFKILELEIDVMRHNADKVPNDIKPKDWLELLNMQTRSQRRKYLSYLFINEKANEKKKAISEQKRIEWEATKLTTKEQEEDTDEMKYDLAHNTLFMRIYKQNMYRYYNFKLIWNMMFEPNIVFDCDYENHMNRHENHNCAKQLTIAFAANRIHDKPMSIYFCNLKEGLLRQYLERNMPNLLDEDFPAVVTSQSYLDLFPKDQLVYLTPHCKTDLVEYDPDMVYIIGAMIDKSSPKPLSLAKAKKEGLRMAKLPVNRYLDWGSGSTKNFTLNQVLSVMLDLKSTGSWEQALQHVPVRKLRGFREYTLQRKLQKTSKFLERMEKQKYNEESDKTQSPMRSSPVTGFSYAAKKRR